MFYDTRPKVNVHIATSNETFPCALDESLLKGMMRLGRKGIPVGCVNGGCGVCKVKIIEGTVKAIGPISRAHVTEDEEAQGYTLACRSAPTVAVCIEVAGKMVKRFTKEFANPADTNGVSGVSNERR